ncbi:hypothetical protein BD779DRAFT_1674453 [Infundibulicybe gibba]|nr:hypothetical protein BD779DRAFT_1674453 [Infundibulicybe gibba]
MADLFPTDEDAAKTPRPTRADKTTAARALKKQQERRELDILMAAVPSGKSPWFPNILTLTYVAQSGGRTAKQAALDNRVWESLMPGKSVKRPPSTPNKASEKVKMPRMAWNKTSPVAIAKQARTSRKPHGKPNKKAEYMPPARDIDVAPVTPKRPAKAVGNPSRGVKSTVTARQHPPPSMDDDEVETESESGNGTSSESELDDTMDVTSDGDHSEDEPGELSELDDEAGNKTGASQKSDEPEGGDSPKGPESASVEVVKWERQNDSSDEDNGAGDTTFRQLPPSLESLTVSRASSVMSFTKEITGLNIIDSDLDDVGWVPASPQPTRRSSAAKSHSSSCPNTPSVAQGAISAGRRASSAQGTMPDGHRVSCKARPAPSPPSDQGTVSSQARSVSSNSESSIQQTQLVQTTVNQKSSSIKVKITKHVPAEPTVLRPTTEPARKKASKRDEKLARESAYWTDNTPTEEVLAKAVTRNTLETKSTVQTVKTSTKLKKEKTTHHASAKHNNAMDYSIVVHKWPESTTFYEGGLNSQAPHIKKLIHHNIDDIVGHLVLENTIPQIPQNPDTNKPFQHPGIIGALEHAFFHGFSEKYQDQFPTTMVKGNVETMIPKVMLALIVTMLRTAILHAADKSWGFCPEKMKPIYQDFMDFMDKFEGEQPGQYKAAMIKIYQLASNTSTQASETSSTINRTWKLLKFSNMESVDD